MNASIRSTNVWLWLSLPIAILLLIAAGCGLFITGLYRDNPYFAVQARAQDLISLVIVLPGLVIAAIGAKRGSCRAQLIWLGTLVYLIYTYVVAAFDNSFNSLFVVYVALMGCALYALIGSLATINMNEIKASFGDKTPVKAISIYLAVLAVLFYFLWLSELVPAIIAGEIPKSIQDNGTPTNAVHVLDMAWILPAFAITAVNLWRKKALGYTLAGPLLAYTVLLILAVLSMVVFMVREGQPVVIPQVAIFITLLAVSSGMLVWYLKGANDQPMPGRSPHPMRVAN